MPNTTYPGPDNIYRAVLDNGIVVLAYENFAAQSVVVEGVVRAGAIVEKRPFAGLADFTADTLLRGTASHSFDEIYEQLEGVNARLSFGSGTHYSDFNAGGLAEDLPLIMALLAEALRQPTFPAEQVEKVRGEILTSLQIRDNDTGEQAELAFYDLLYGDHPYAISPDGYPDSIRAISQDDLARFHADYYGPEGMIVTIVGAVPAATAVEQVRAALGDWRRDGQKPLPDAPPVARPLTTLRADVPMPDKSQCDIVLGLPAPPRSAPDFLDLSLMNTVLGVFGMMGRLGKSIREAQGLAYYIHSQLEGDFGPSPWVVSTGVAPHNVERAIGSIRKEIARIQTEPVPTGELADSQAYRTGSLPVRLETNRGLASNITNMELFDLGLDYLRRYPDLIREITVERVQAAAQKYLSTEQLAIAVAGPPAE